jgi:hypothetical protein
MHKSCEEGIKLGDVYREIKRKVGADISIGLAANILPQSSFSSKVSRKKPENGIWFQRKHTSWTKK